MSGRRGRAVAGQDGNAAITVLGTAVVTLLIVAGVVDIGMFFLARQRAQTAADSAALAAAAELIPGIGQDPNGEAGRYASANGARLVRCDCAMGGRSAQVKVAVPVRFTMLFSSGRRDIAATARADVDLAALRRPPN